MYSDLSTKTRHIRPMASGLLPCGLSDTTSSAATAGVGSLSVYRVSSRGRGEEDGTGRAGTHAPLKGVVASDGASGFAGEVATTNSSAAVGATTALGRGDAEGKLPAPAGGTPVSAGGTSTSGPLSPLAPARAPRCTRYASQPRRGTAAARPAASVGSLLSPGGGARPS